MLVLDADAVRRLHPMEESIALMRTALQKFSSGAVIQPQRAMLRTPDGDAFAVMPAVVTAGDQAEEAAGRGGFGVKVVAVKPGNPALGFPAILGLVLVLDERGVPDALMDGGAVTAIRTAAASGAATDLLAREDASTLALLGSGVQARSHLEAMAAVRSLSRVRVWSRDPDRARAFADEAAAFPFPVEPADTVARATADADIICTVTGSVEPLLLDGHVATGAHINAVGSSFPDHRELSGALVARCSVYVDSRTAAQAEAGDLLLAAAEGHIPAGAVGAEVGEVLLGLAPGRRKPEETTLFKSLGMAVEDVVAGLDIARRARDLSIGVEVPFLDPGSLGD
jgi:ornithine cyclodeaminase/alanine dehydrogenase-like protein (mu-crystallin family)